MDPKGIEPLASTLQVSRSSQLSYGPIFYGERNQLPLHFPLVSLCFNSATTARLLSHLQSTPLLAVTLPPLTCFYVTPQQCLVMVCLKATPKITCSFFFKIFGGPSLTVSLLWQGDYVVNQKL